MLVIDSPMRLWLGISLVLASIGAVRCNSCRQCCLAIMPLKPFASRCNRSSGAPEDRNCLGTHRDTSRQVSSKSASQIRWLWNQNTEASCAGDVAKVVHSRQCVNGDGQEVPCCAWAPDAWVPPYMSLASVMLLWTVFLAGQFRIFTISGTVAQWSASFS